MATPSRWCAAREPAISAWFFVAFISAIGSAPRIGLPPLPAISRVSASAALALSSRTVLPLNCVRSCARSPGARSVAIGSSAGRVLSSSFTGSI